ncbi:MAG: hypothetical protein GXO09_02310 [Crenarchaeota archaeon]|nr:hypothetical protein [Thermoproteota archaeon]
MENVEVRVVGKPEKLLESIFKKLVDEIIEKKIDEALAAALNLLATARDQALASIEEEVENILRMALERLRAHESSLEARLRVDLAKLRAEYTERAVQEALRRLRDAVKEDEYREVLRKLLLDALRLISSYTSEAVVTPTKRDYDIVKEILPEVMQELTGLNIRLAEQPVEGIGGFIVESSDGRVRFDYRLESLLSQALDRARARALKELFGEQG